MSNVKNYTEQGGEKTVIGGILEITTNGQFLLGGNPVIPAANQADSSATTVEGLATDFNALLTKLKAAGLMAADG